MQDNRKESGKREKYVSALNVTNTNIALTALYNQENTLNKQMAALNKQMAALRKQREELHKSISIQKSIRIREILRLRWGERGKIAIKKYAQFHNKDIKNITLYHLAHSSCGIHGWYKCNLDNNYSLIPP